MKRVLLLTLTLILVVTVPCGAQQSRTLKSEMEVIHKLMGVNFVYDSSIELDVPYDGRPMKDMRTESLEACLNTLFAGTDIEFEIMKKYVVLTKASKKRPRDYAIFVEEQRDTLDESRITAYIDHRHSTTQTGLTTIDGSRFRNGHAVLGTPDLIKEIQIMPGVSGGTELLSGVYVHGGDGSDNLFLLDGVPLYQVTHLLGLFSSFNTEVVDNLDFYKSGFPSRYGGKLSSVVDVTTKTGDMHEYHGSVSIGLLNGGLQFEGPIVPGKTSFNVAVRRTWFDLVTIPMNLIGNMKRPYGETSNVHYSMTDLNASVTHLFNADSRLSLNFYLGADKIANEWRTKEVKYWEGVRHTGDDGTDLDLSWGNLLASLKWSRKFNDQLHLNAIAYYVKSNADVTIGHLSWEMDTEDPIITEIVRVEDNHSKLHDLGAKVDIDWIPSEYHHFNTGVSYVGHMFTPSRDFSMSTLKNSQPLYAFDDSYALSYDASEASAYASDEITFFSWFKANLGLRYTYFKQGGYDNHSFEPRAALRFQLGQKTALKMSYTEMSQAVHQIRANYIDLPMISWLPSTEKIPPMRSRQVAAGVYMDLPHNITLNLEGYWKTMDNIHEYSGVDNMYPDISMWEYQLAKGMGRSYGLETELHWRTTKVDLAAYYTLSWSERLFERVWHDWYPARNDNRHKLTLTSTVKFSDRFDMYASWNYHTGDWATVHTQMIDGEVYYTRPYNYQMSDYHRLDLGFNFRKTTKRGNESVWNLSVYNAYCRLNPMFSMLDIDKETGTVSLVEKGIVPIIPSFNYTLRF